MDWYLIALKKYAVIDGRARRKEYWYFFLFNLIIMLLLSTVDYTVGTVDIESGTGLFGTLYALAIFIPSITVGVRRLHDLGRTGWWMLLSLIPIIGSIILIIFFVQPSESGKNEYGPNPIND